MSPIQGQLLRLSARRQVAIYRREDTLWVADFIDGQGELMDATTWFRFNCGTQAATHARRRMVRESAIPIPSQLVEKIECLHCPAAAARDSATSLAAESISRGGSGGRFASMLRRLFRRRYARGAHSTKARVSGANAEIHRRGAT
jgi:hypothetical protein